MGLALGSALIHYMLNLFGPPLIEEFGWQKSEFALVSSLSLFTLVFIPFLGRFVDRVGARLAGVIGYTIVPLCFLAFSFMSGNIYEFYAITMVKNIFGVLTTSLVFCRIVVERFDTARGMALAIVMSGPPLIGAIAVPIFGEIIESEGWRTGYRAMALVSAVGGFAAIALVGFRKGDGKGKPAPVRKKSPPLTRQQFMAIVRQPVFALLVGGMFLVNFPQVIVSSQMKLVLFESGASNSFATWLVSLYAISVIIGRFASGFALDRIPAHIVATFTLGMPAFGLIALATPYDASWVLFGAIALTGLAQGAEGDIGAILTSRKFDIQHYSFVYSFLIASIGAASAVGSVVLSLMLRQTDSYNGFLVLGGIVTVLGVVLFYLIGRYGKSSHESAPEPAPQSA